MKKGLSIFSFLIYLCLSPLALLLAQNESSGSQEQEVYLSFRHRGAVDQMVISYYDGREQTFYLPVTELFSTLGITYEVNQDKLTISGTYLDTGSRYTFNFQNQYAEFQNRRLSLSSNDYLIKELDFYVKANILSRLLDLQFATDFSNLSLSLESDYTMPVVAERQRKSRREREMDEPSIQREDFPLQFNRESSILDGAFLDYNLASNITSDLNLYTYNFNTGAEFLAGDVQGSMSGSWSRVNSSFNTNNLRWRYVMRENDWVSRIRVGQSVTDDIQSRSFTGLKISNDPIEPRISFDEYVVQGETQPQSEVELYLNNSLIDFQEADELGNYRFVIPLTYGSSRLRIRIYGPDGGVRELNRRILVPFNFQKPGELRYSVSAGRMDRGLIGTTERGYLAQSEVRMGVNRNLTVGGGMEYLEPIHTSQPLFYGTFSSRLFTNYLVNADLAPDAFYRLQTSTVYASSAGWGVDYTYYPSDNFYNRSGNDHEIRGNFFVPFNIGPMQFNTRLTSTHRRGPGSNTTRYRFDLNTRIGRVTIRGGFRDQQIGPLEATTTSNSQLTGSFTYTLSRRSTVPGILQGMFIRGQVDYSNRTSSVERANLQLSRNISETGRLRVSYDRNFTGGYNNFNLGLTFNFSKTRSTSTLRSNRGDFAYTQNMRGTVGYDSRNNDVVLDNRQQVGRSAATVRLFVDENNNSEYDDGEKLIDDNAVQLRRTGNVKMSGDSTIHMMQLQAYNRLNAKINKSALTNPLYIPEIEEFSFIADPNQFKPIDIPFYQSGVISGNIYQMKTDTSTKEPVAGLRLTLEGVNNDFSKELRTFSDGGFYSMEVPPGKYRLLVDSTQLDFLNANSDPSSRNFQVEAKAQGDFVENLDFTLKPRADTSDSAQPIAKVQDQESSEDQPRDTEKDTTSFTPYNYAVQLAGYNMIGRAIQGIRQFLDTQDSVSHTLYMRKNTHYTVLSESSESIADALRLMSNLREKHFPDAFLVKTHTPNPDNINFHIQLGVYKTKQAAQHYADRAKQALNQEIVVEEETASEATGSDTTYTINTASISSLTEALSKEDSINTHTSFDSAFLDYRASRLHAEVTFEQLLLVGPFSSRKKAQNRAKALNNQNFQINLASFDNPSGTYLIIEQDKGPNYSELADLISQNPDFKDKIQTVLLKTIRPKESTEATNQPEN